MMKPMEIAFTVALIAFGASFVGLMIEVDDASSLRVAFSEVCRDTKGTPVVDMIGRYACLRIPAPVITNNYYPTPAPTLSWSSGDVILQRDSGNIVDGTSVTPNVLPQR